MTARPTGDDEELARARVELTLALRIAARHDLHEGIDNHFSIALDAQRFLVNSYGKHWSEICPGDILEVDQDGTVLSGSGHWDIAAFTIHRAAHAARPDARAVFHTHMTQATAVANTAESLDTRLTQSAMYFHGRVSTLDFDGLATAEEEGRRLERAFAGGTSAVMMRNHGVLAIGANIPDAWHKLYMLERACAVQVATYAQGREVVRVSEQVAAKTSAQWLQFEEETAELLFEAEVRVLARDCPEVAEWRQSVSAEQRIAVLR
jgi:ribulose-5-phosphate 4-epimerase/fuculose-1-phosphate aldolase